MLTRKLTKHGVFVFSVLFATVVKEIILHSLPSFKDTQPFLGTLIGMAVIVLIFYPVFIYVSKFSKLLSKEYLKTAKKLRKSSLQGLLIGIIVGLIIFYGILMYLWFEKNIFAELGLI